MASPPTEVAIRNASLETISSIPGVSREAAQLTADALMVDLHLDTFIPPRLTGYNLHKKHRQSVLGGRFFGHLDFPRVEEAGLNGAMWSITTNPFRLASSRWRVFQKNLARFRKLIRDTGGRFVEVTTCGGFEEAVAAGKHAVLFSIQGGNALAAAPEGVLSVPDDVIVRVTLVHLTSSCYGVTSSPLRFGGGKKGLTVDGIRCVEQLNARRVFVDLAHINPAGFWHAVDVHDATQPLIATHTGVCGVRPHWRNLDDAQVKAVADTGGVVGIIFAGPFLRRKGGPRDEGMILEHMEHVMNVAGEGAVAIGSDYDGAITPPRPLRNGTHYARLVQGMLERRWSEERIRGVLGLNFLECFRRLRP
jgi:membrane dipeptidase